MDGCRGKAVGVEHVQLGEPRADAARVRKFIIVTVDEQLVQRAPTHQAFDVQAAAAAVTGQGNGCQGRTVASHPLQGDRRSRRASRSSAAGTPRLTNTGRQSIVTSACPEAWRWRTTESAVMSTTPGISGLAAVDRTAEQRTARTVGIDGADRLRRVGVVVLVEALQRLLLGDVEIAEELRQRLELDLLRGDSGHVTLLHSGGWAV